MIKLLALLLITVFNASAQQPGDIHKAINGIWFYGQDEARWKAIKTALAKTKPNHRDRTALAKSSDEIAELIVKFESDPASAANVFDHVLESKEVISSSGFGGSTYSKNQAIVEGILLKAFKLKFTKIQEKLDLSSTSSSSSIIKFIESIGSIFPSKSEVPKALKSIKGTDRSREVSTLRFETIPQLKVRTTTLGAIAQTIVDGIKNIGNDDAIIAVLKQMNHMMDYVEAIEHTGDLESLVYLKSLMNRDMIDVLLELAKKDLLTDKHPSLVEYLFKTLRIRNPTSTAPSKTARLFNWATAQKHIPSQKISEYQYRDLRAVFDAIFAETNNWNDPELAPTRQLMLENRNRITAEVAPGSATNQLYIDEKYYQAKVIVSDKDAATALLPDKYGDLYHTDFLKKKRAEKIAVNIDGPRDPVASAKIDSFLHSQRKYMSEKSVNKMLRNRNFKNNADYKKALADKKLLLRLQSIVESFIASDHKEAMVDDVVNTLSKYEETVYESILSRLNSEASGKDIKYFCEVFFKLKLKLASKKRKSSFSWQSCLPTDLWDDANDKRLDVRRSQVLHYLGRKTSPLITKRNAPALNLSGEDLNHFIFGHHIGEIEAARDHSSLYEAFNLKKLVDANVIRLKSAGSHQKRSIESVILIAAEMDELGAPVYQGLLYYYLRDLSHNISLREDNVLINILELLSNKHITSDDIKHIITYPPKTFNAGADRALGALVSEMMMSQDQTLQFKGLRLLLHYRTLQPGPATFKIFSKTFIESMSSLGSNPGRILGSLFLQKVDYHSKKSTLYTLLKILATASENFPPGANEHRYVLSLLKQILNIIKRSVPMTDFVPDTVNKLYRHAMKTAPILQNDDQFKRAIRNLGPTSYREGFGLYIDLIKERDFKPKWIISGDLLNLRDAPSRLVAGLGHSTNPVTSAIIAGNAIQALYPNIATLNPEQIRDLLDVLMKSAGQNASKLLLGHILGYHYLNHNRILKPHLEMLDQLFSTPNLKARALKHVINDISSATDFARKLKYYLLNHQSISDIEMDQIARRFWSLVGDHASKHEVNVIVKFLLKPRLEPHIESFLKKSFDLFTRTNLVPSSPLTNEAISKLDTDNIKKLWKDVVNRSKNRKGMSHEAISSMAKDFVISKALNGDHSDGSDFVKRLQAPVPIATPDGSIIPMEMSITHSDAAYKSRALDLLQGYYFKFKDAPMELEELIRFSALLSYVADYVGAIGRFDSEMQTLYTNVVKKILSELELKILNDPDFVLSPQSKKLLKDGTHHFVIDADEIPKLWSLMDGFLSGGGQATLQSLNLCLSSDLVKFQFFPR